MTEWKNSILGDVLTLQRGFDLPVQSRKIGKFPIVASTGIVGTHNEFKVKGPGVTIGRSGSIGGGQFILKDFWPLNTTLWVKDFKGNDARYCYYLLKNFDFSTYNVGSGVPTLNRNHIHPLPVKFAPPFEQKAIASFLGVLDDKIENNLHMNQTLEEMARAIFRSWFVDFDPVHAKASGKAPVHMDSSTAAQFPNSFGDDGLPSGWCLKPISDFAVIKGGKQLTKNFIFENGLYPVFGGAGIMGKTDESNAEGFLITVGRVGVYCGQFFSYRGKAWINNNASQIIPLEGVSEEYLLYSLKELDLNPIKKGAAQPFVSNSDIAALNIIHANETIMNLFDEAVHKLQLKIEANTAENTTLVSLRDTLLPKLISGEVRLKDVEHEVEVLV